MAQPDFLALQDRVLARDYGASADRTQAKLFINESYEDVSRRHKWPWLMTSATITLTAGVATFDLSTLNPDLMYHGRLRPVASGVREPKEIPFHSEVEWNLSRYYPTLEANGQPEFVARTGERSLLFMPTPDIAYQYTYYYWREIASLVNDTDEPLMPPADRQVLVFGALKRMGERDRDFAAVGYYEQQYENTIAQMRQRSNAQARINVDRVPMPAHYNGEFDL